MDTEQIRDFLTVARYKNFSKAAEALYIGQPALSRRISGLERQLGVQLFLRSNKAVELTRAGEILQREGQHIIEQLEQLEVKMQAAGQGAQGSIRVTTMGRLSDRVSQTIRRTIAALPDCDVEMEVLVPGEQGDGLEPLDTDVAFLLGSYPSDDTGHKHVVPLEDAPFSFLLPAGHPLAGRKEICPEDLRGGETAPAESEPGPRPDPGPAPGGVQDRPLPAGLQKEPGLHRPRRGDGEGDRLPSGL